MRATDRLEAFVADALRAGHPREEIARHLRDAGWGDTEIAAALDNWHDGPFALPVPRPAPSQSAREAFLYGLTFIAFAICMGQAASLGFALIDGWIADPGDAPGFSRWRVRGAAASLLVFLPILAWLSVRQARADQSDGGQRRSAVRDWLGHTALLIAALILLADLVTVVYAFLNGDVTLRFALKSALTAALAGITFLYFRRLTGTVRAS